MSASNVEMRRRAPKELMLISIGEIGKMPSRVFLGTEPPTYQQALDPQFSYPQFLFSPLAPTCAERNTDGNDRRRRETHFAQS
ncbi:Uncharacterised protein [Chlamydia trachomatis]|nr:Uncharacterised protein [Chlamydia trachomatis]CRH90313.1 Uncharacterised protein [Chlamydia trachomatis]